MYGVLLVDDEYYVRAMMRRCVDWEQCGFEIVDEARSGEQAIALAMEKRPDLIMLDINLPDMTGFGVAGCLQQSGLDAKIIIVTGYEIFEFAKKAIQYHVHDYVLKPVIPMELVKILESVRRELEEEAQRQSQLRQLTQNVEELLKKVSLIDESVGAAGEDEVRDGGARQLAEKARVYVEEHINDPELSVSKISEALFVNMSYLSALFKKVQGQGLHEYMTALRMDRAYDMIIKTDLQVGEIAQALGVSRDPVYFSKTLKKHFGKTFQELRRIRRKYMG